MRDATAVVEGSNTEETEVIIKVRPLRGWRCTRVRRALAVVGMALLMLAPSPLRAFANHDPVCTSTPLC